MAKKKRSSNMKLSAPKYITWLIAVIVGVVGLLMHFGVLSLGGVSATVLIAIGFVLLAVATAVKGL
jgi:nicotinamide riboside transporter PnuC